MKSNPNLLAIFVPALILLSIHSSYGQFLSNLSATRNSAIYTTYAAPIERSNYKLDQGYFLRWNDDNSGVEFASADGPNTGIAFRTGERTIFRLAELYRQPVITLSYSDLVCFHYYPVAGLRVEVFFAVYSSSTAFAEYRIIHEGMLPLTVELLPYFYIPAQDTISRLIRSSNPEYFSMALAKKRDSWMNEHNIPVAESLHARWMITGLTSTSGLQFFRDRTRAETGIEEEHDALITSMTGNLPMARYVQGIIRSCDFTMQPGDTTSLRLTLSLSDGKTGSVAGTYEDPPDSGLPDSEELIEKAEKVYAGIPDVATDDKDLQLLYWSAFNLMRQCMMPPEGRCGHNYYVFSREPKWGWGYGGQVFHESLAMLAYVLMDPAGAMNSQRIYMERQRPDGYINYRTGPYLDETIETSGKPTSSAPWYNFINLEIFGITGDKKFLGEAYASGKRYYQYYVASRDSNHNGLCEWGGHAELESVRDARVAVWDHVGWASNFEGPDINALLVKEARSLSQMAEILGFTTEASAWENEAVKRAELINRICWDPVARFYFNVARNDQSFTYSTKDDLKIKEIIGFLPLWAGVCDTSHARMVVAVLKDTSEFWRRFGIPSLSARETVERIIEKTGFNPVSKGGFPPAVSGYNPMGYWNGPVWVQWNYLVYRGLRDYGYFKDASELSSRLMQSMILHLKKDHVFWEFYSPDDVQAGWNKTYFWAGIVARMMLDEYGKRGGRKP